MPKRCSRLWAGASRWGESLCGDGSALREEGLAQLPGVCLQVYMVDLPVGGDGLRHPLSGEGLHTVQRSHQGARHAPGAVHVAQALELALGVELAVVDGHRNAAQGITV